MQPIGIVTRNRAPYLDITLRSLSATQLPEGQFLTVYDDASDSGSTRDYLYTERPSDFGLALPNNAAWQRAGLSMVRSRQAAPGLAGRINVVPLGVSSSGVMQASCRALSLLTANYPNQAVVLLQDDVVFSADWMQALQDEAARRICFGARPAPGVICGCDINRELTGPSPSFLAPHGGITAQCYYFTAAGATALQDWLRHPPSERVGFDNKLCAAIRAAGLGVYLMTPGICQHFGVTSLVRPKCRWTWLGAAGRVDQTAQGPFVLAPDVRPFPFAVDGDAESP